MVAGGLKMHDSEIGLIQRLRGVPWRSLGRWWVVGLAAFGSGTGALYLAVGVLHLPLPLATMGSAELINLVRFLVNDRWVFGNRRPTWRRCWQYHVANAGSFAIWWAVSNFLPTLGVQYLIASALGTCTSVTFSMATNFLWVWRRRRRPLVAEPAVDGGDAGAN